MYLHEAGVWASEQKGLYCFRDVRPPFLSGKKKKKLGAGEREGEDATIRKEDH